MTDPDTPVWIFPLSENEEDRKKIVAWAKRKNMRAFLAIDTRLPYSTGIQCQDCGKVYRSHTDMKRQLRDEGYPGQLFSIKYMCDNYCKSWYISDTDSRFGDDYQGFLQRECENCIVAMHYDGDDPLALELTTDDEGISDPSNLPEPQLWKDVSDHFLYILFNRDEIFD